MHTSISISNGVACITTTNNEIYMVDIEKNELTPWSRRNSILIPNQFLVRKETICGSFHYKNKQWIYGRSYIFPISLDQDLTKESVWRLDHRFQSLMYCNVGGDEIILVERPVLQLLAELPEAFQKKKFAS